MVILSTVCLVLLITGIMATGQQTMDTKPGVPVQQEQQTAKAVPVPSDVQALAWSITGFTRDLYDQISNSNPGGNLFFSPVSIAVALGMTYVGARGNTASQMAEALKLKPGDDCVHFRKLLDILSANDAQYTLSTANNIFVDKKFKMLDKYLNVVKTSFHADATNVNFAGDTESARSTINQWVEKETNAKIKELIPSGGLSSKTAMVLANAIYFKGNWQSKFKAEVTYANTFHLSNNKNIMVDMMYQKAKLPLGCLTELDCQILELPYVQNDLSMFILLPRRADGLSQLEQSFTPAILQSVRSFVSLQTVDVYLPKFKLEEGQELNDVLSKLWVKDLFSEGVADLSGIDDTKELYVSNVIHKAFIEVNEEGTEAAAASGVVVRKRMAMRNEEFKADRPFLFFILHKKTGTILFIGRLSKPEVSATWKNFNIAPKDVFLL